MKPILNLILLMALLLGYVAGHTDKPPNTIAHSDSRLSRSERS